VRSPAPTYVIGSDGVHDPHECLVKQLFLEIYVPMGVEWIDDRAQTVPYSCLLAELGETNERRNQRSPGPHAKPSLTATAPNQAWTWDITKLATLQPRAGKRGNHGLLRCWRRAGRCLPSPALWCRSAGTSGVWVVHAVDGDAQRPVRFRGTF
jgi:hypothetical protein